MAAKGICGTAKALAEITHMDSAMFSARLEIDFKSAKLFSSAGRYGIYLRRIHRTCAHRALFVTRKGYMELAPWNVQVGDLVCVLRGGKTPFLLRRLSSGGRHGLVGEAFVDGIMTGEVFDWEYAQAATRMFYLT
jgi:hypothetical protein